MSVGWTHLLQTEVASEAGSGKVSFDVSTSRLALWWQVAEGRCILESTREKVVMAKA